MSTAPSPLPETMPRELAVAMAAACYERGIHDARVHIMDILTEMKDGGAKMTVDDVIKGLALSTATPAEREEQGN